MTKKLTKKQKERNAIQCYYDSRRGRWSLPPLCPMFQAWQHLVDTGAVWEPPRLVRTSRFQNDLARHIDPAPLEEETPNNEDEQ